MKYAVGRLDKNNHFRKKKKKKSCKSLGWAVKKWPKRNITIYITLFFLARIGEKKKYT